jgi:mannose-1-phosphate guanylyltransferase/mannose-1-phosphate guanylyltransferase/mannose-6-phosphate isomerase
MDDPRFAPLTIVCASEQRFGVGEQLREIEAPAPTIVTEPSARNTAAAAAIAALIVHAQDPDGLVLLLPTDHMIVNEGALRAAFVDGASPAEEGFVTLFGIKPDSPATGYGYIRIDPARLVGAHAFRAAAFVEKPDKATAESYLAAGDHVWNSGIALAGAATLLDAFARHEPALLDAARDALRAAKRDADFLRLDPDCYQRCRSVAFDNAILEKSDRIAVMPVAFGWRDVGTWSALFDASDRDADGNAFVGNVIAEATKDSYVRSEGPLVATLGIEGLVVVATDDAVLVVAKERDQDVRKIVDRVAAMRHAGPSGDLAGTKRNG